MPEPTKSSLDAAIALKVLHRAQDTLSHPDRWCKAAELHAQDAAGSYIQVWDQDASKWSLIGAVALCGMRLAPLSPVPGLRDESEFNAAWKYLFMAGLLQSSGSMTPNGINNNGYESAKSLLAFAIKLAENGAELLITLAIDPDSPMGKEMAAKCETAAAAQEKGEPN